MFGKGKWVKDFEYWRKQDDRSRKENLRYYLDNEVIDRGLTSFGVWRSFAHSTSSPLTLAIKDGDAVNWEQADKISRRIDPATDKLLYQSRTKRQLNAMDCPASAPKDYSVFHGIAKAEAGAGGANAKWFEDIAAALQSAHVDANNFSLEWLFEKGAFQSRSGHAGKDREGAKALLVAQFLHYTSQDGDMQLHTHNVIPNVGLRADGTYGAIDNFRYRQLRGQASALYRAQLYSLAKERLAPLGIELVYDKNGRNVRFVGMPESVTRHFSKRRKAIIAELHARGIKNSANHTEAAQIASYATRGSKDDIPPLPILHNMWKVELGAMGYSFASLAENMQMEGRKFLKERTTLFEAERSKAEAQDRPFPATEKEWLIEGARKRAHEQVADMSSAFEGRHFKQAVLEELQVFTNADEALKISADIEADAGLLQVAVVGRGGMEPVLTTEATLKKEYEIIDLVKSMRDNLVPCPTHIVEDVIAKGLTNQYGETFELRDEQKAVVREIFGPHQVGVCIGDPGTGKTTTMQKAREVADLLGMETFIGGPTNKSVDVLRGEVGVNADHAHSVAGIINHYEAGNLKISKNSLVLIDEAGMVSTADKRMLMRIAKETGARFYFIGDPKQLPSVMAGAPLRMIYDVVGGVRMTEIARQKHSWMIEASKALADGRTEDGIRAYADRGHIVFCDDDESVYADAVEEVFKGEPNDALVLGKTNGEVAFLNEALEKKKIEMGLLRGPASEHEVLTRGQDPKPVMMSFMEGHRIITNDNVRMNGERVANNTVGTILKIRFAEGEEAEWTVRWDDGKTMTFKPSQFVGLKDADGPNQGIPRIAKADAMTYYASQGVTSKRVIVASAEALSKEASLVALTRHKNDLSIFANGGRLETEIVGAGAKSFAISATGDSKPTDDEEVGEITPEQVLNRYIAECSTETRKNNASDYIGGAEAFYERMKQHIGDEDVNETDFRAKLEAAKIFEYKESREEVAMQPEMKDQLNQNEGALTASPSFMKPFVRGLGRIGGEAIPKPTPKTEVEKFEALMERTYNAKPNKPKVAKEPENMRLSKDEIHTLVQQNLKDYMLANGATLKNTSRDGGEFTLSFGKGKGCVVKEWPGGNWTFFMRDRSAKGDIRNFVAWRDGVEIGEAMHRLREEFGTKDRHATAPAHVIDRNAKPTETNRQRFERLLSESYVAEKFRQIRNWWNQGKQAESSYLTGRGIERETQARFKDDFRCEGKDTFDGKNRGGVMFAMKDADGNLTGFHRKGFKPFPTAKRDLSYNVEGTERHMLVMGDPWKASRVYVAEAPIDGLSLFQRDGRPQNASVLAFAGSAPENGLAQLYKIAKDNPAVEWHYVAQNDEADIVNEMKAKEAILEGNPSAKIEARRPPEQFKDWNDELRGKVRPVEEKAPALTPDQIAEQRKADEEANARHEKYEAQKVRIAEQQRKAAEEAQNKGRGPTLG